MYDNRDPDASSKSRVARDVASVEFIEFVYIREPGRLAREIRIVEFRDVCRIGRIVHAARCL